MAIVEKSTSKRLMVVVIDGELKLEYDRQKSISELQQKYLTKMDSDMGGGITLHEQRIESPDKIQRAKFVANLLLHAYMKQNDQQIAAMCAYLAKTLPELTQVCINSVEDNYHIDLKFDEVLENQVKVNFPTMQ